MLFSQTKQFYGFFGQPKHKVTRIALSHGIHSLNVSRIDVTPSDRQGPCFPDHWIAPDAVATHPDPDPHLFVRTMAGD